MLHCNLILLLTNIKINVHIKVCKKCNELIEQGNVKVMAARVEGDHGWHPQCFK